MIDVPSLPPAAPACLVRASPSSQKGGTLIAEDVLDLAEHEARLEDPDRYRPERCERCGAPVHVHDLKLRLLGGRDSASTEILRFRCADRPCCGAVWRILPGFLAGHLWRAWSEVEGAIEAPVRSRVPPRTRRRWRARLRTAARMLVAILHATGIARWERLADAVGWGATRGELVGAYRAQRPASPSGPLAELAGLVHRLEPGVRLM